MKLSGLVLALLVAVCAADTLRLKYQEIEARQANLIRNQALTWFSRSNGVVNGLAEAAIMNQRIDHYSASDSRTFAQRYWINRMYWDRENGPVFVYIGGEGELSGSVIDSTRSAGYIVEMAQKHRALLVALEHRYYGKSMPFNEESMKSENLVYLSSSQALEDLAAFWQYINAKEHVDPARQPWVAFGGSYPGCLSAWIRSAYPHVAVASLASSAPVFAKADYYEYDQVVRESLATKGDKCLKAVHESMDKLDLALRTSKLETEIATLYDGFGCGSGQVDSADPAQLAYVVADALSFTVQYTQDTQPNRFTYKILDKLCDDITKDSSLESLGSFVRWLHMKMGTTCKDSAMDAVLDTTVLAASRPWFYQSCTEFGYFQTAPPKELHPLRSGLISLDWHWDLCRKAFPTLKNADLPALIEASNARHGGRRTSASRIFFSNGSLDPWKALGATDLSSQPTLDSYAYVINGTSHCADLHASVPSDPTSLTVSRSLSSSFIARWLSEATASTPVKGDIKETMII